MAQRPVSRRIIDVVSGVAMLGGALFAVVVGVDCKAASPATGFFGVTTIYGWEVLLYMALGAAPGWLVRGLLLHRFHPETRTGQQPRCRACGAVLSCAGERCGDCGAF